MGYIPAADAAFANWATNWADQMTTDSGDGTLAYNGVTASQAANAINYVTDFLTKYAAAINPLTRTPVTIAEKDQAREQTQQALQEASQVLQTNINTTDAIRSRYGLTIRKTTRTPVPPPTSHPLLGVRSQSFGTVVLAYTDAMFPEGKAKPPGAIGVEVWTRKATDNAWGRVATATKSPFVLDTTSYDAGEQYQVKARYCTRSGPGGEAQFGPWSETIAFYAT